MKQYVTYLKFNTESIEELIELIDIDINKKNKSFVITPNLDFLRLSYKDESFRKIINESEYSLVDGKPIVWLAKKEKKKINKISGSDFIYPILKLANDRSYSILLFGGKEGVAEKAKSNILNSYPLIKEIHCYSPSYGYEKDKEERNRSIEFINQCKSDIIILCTGSPKTEMFYFENKDMFNSGVYLSLGATIDFIAGNIKRAPKWMSKIGLEWLYRLSKDFKRLFKRYWLDFWFLFKIVFICIFNKESLKKMRG